MGNLFGKWNVETKTPMGKQKAVWHFYEENGVAKGIVHTEGKPYDCDSLEVNGDHFVMKVRMKAGFAKMDFVMEGDVSGDTVSGSSAMKLGSSPFVGQRIAEEAAEQNEAPQASGLRPLDVAVRPNGKMKVLGISAGHAMGNSEMLLREALMGAEEAGAEVELIRLNDFEIKQCIGCQMCTMNMMQKGQDNLCIQKDDFPLLREHLLECDAVIYSAPIFLIRPIASLLKLSDRIGPFHDVGGLESVGMRGPESPLDQRLFKQRCAGFISVGGAVRPEYASMGLTLMNDLTYPMHIKVVDQVMVLDSNVSGQALMHDDEVARCRELGKNVAMNAGKPENEMKWCGDFDGTCPVCHGNLMTVDNGDETITCAICGIKGKVSMEGGKLNVEFPRSEWIHSRLTREECAYHYAEIFQSLGQFQDVAGEVKEREKKYRTYDIPVIKPAKN